MDPERFFAALGDAPSRVLLLDYDGTLAPFHEDRGRAVPYPEAAELVREIQGDGSTRVVVISGRMVSDLLPLLGIEPVPEVWGTHGWERLRPGGSVELTDPGNSLRERLVDAARRAREIASATRVEVKPASVAVHVRGLDAGQSRTLLAYVRSAWAPLLDLAGLELRDFDGGLELRAAGHDKGTALREILSEEPEGAAVAYLGDDLTDEDAFRVLRGRGLSVLVRRELRDTSADVWIRPPEELIGFLRSWRSASAPASRPATT